MINYLIRRLVLIVPTALAASVIVFFVMRALPGDVALAILADTPHTVEMREALREELGLNDPLAVQYAAWIRSLLFGELGGRSLETREPISEIVSRQLPVTLLLAAYATGLSLIIGVPLGIAAALHRGRPLDYSIRAVTLAGLSVPGVFASLLVMWLLLRLFRWSSPIIYATPREDFGEHVAIMIVPAIILSWEFLSHVVRVMRAGLVSILEREYVVTARSKGLTELAVVVKHGVPNAMLPVITITGIQFGTLIGGAMIVETIFGLPGIGRGIVRAALARDYPLVQSVATLVVTLSLGVNLLVDFAYAAIDPRITFAGRSR